MNNWTSWALLIIRVIGYLKSSNSPRRQDLTMLWSILIRPLLHEQLLVQVTLLCFCLWNYKARYWFIWALVSPFCVAFKEKVSYKKQGSCYYWLILLERLSCLAVKLCLIAFVTGSKQVCRIFFFLMYIFVYAFNSSYTFFLTSKIWLYITNQWERFL